MKKVFDILPEDKRYMEPGRSQMIKHGMISGEYKEPKNIRPYQGNGDEDPEAELKAADGITVSARKQRSTLDDDADAVAARRAAGCPF